MANTDNKCAELEIENLYEKSLAPLEDLIDLQTNTQKMYFKKSNTTLFESMTLEELISFWHMNNHALIDEILETLDAYGGILDGVGHESWQSGKKSQKLSLSDDLELRYELIDQLHFIFNMWISIGGTPSRFSEWISLDYESYFEEIQNKVSLYNKSTKKIVLDSMLQIENIHHATDSLGGLNNGISSAVWKKWKANNKKIKDLTIKDLSTSDYQSLEESIIKIFYHFLSMWIKSGYSKSDLYNLYLAKNKENWDRQKRGY